MDLCVLGVYTFRFSDDLYGLKLSITTHLREPHEISDTPVADYVSLINDEARMLIAAIIDTIMIATTRTTTTKKTSQTTRLLSMI